MLRRKSIKIIKRAVKWTGLTLALTAGVASVGLYMLTSSINNDDMRTLLGQEFKAATGRSLAIEGAISIEPGLLPVIEIGAVSFSNAAWSDNPVMLRAEQVVGRFSLLQLIRGSFVLDEIHIQDVSLLLETDVEGRNNWGFEGVATAGPEFLVQPSTTPSDQVNDLLSFLLSITSFVDEFHINDLSVRYTNDDRKINQTYDIAWARLESADQDSRLVLDVGAGAARRNQTLHVEIYDGADFHAGNGDLGLAVAIDAVKWKAQATGILTPARNATSVDLEASLEATDAVALYHDLGEMIVLPAWPDVPEKMALDFKSSVRGSLSHPVMDNTTLVVDGNQGSRISFSGMVDDFLNEGSISGQVSATVNDPVAYAAGLADFPVFLKDMKDIDFGDAVIAGDLGGRLVSPILKNATLDWGTKKTMITSARNLTLGASPFTLSSELSITIQNEHFISTYLWNVLPPPFDKLPSIPGGVSLNASIDTSPDGRLDAEGVELEFGQGSALKASLSGRVGDVLGRVDPNVTISIASESDRFIHDMATALAPEDWANRVLPVAPLSGEATLQRDEAGRLAMSVSSLDFGDPDVAHVSLNGKLSGLTSLDEV